MVEDSTRPTLGIEGTVFEDGWNEDGLSVRLEDDQRMDGSWIKDR